MAISLQYLISPSLEELFRDKDTGAPLRNGVIYFWQDDARTIPKLVYKQTGSPPDYTYVALPNPLELSSIGTTQDPNTGDDIKIFYHPYDTDGNIQLYFIEVYSEGGKTTGVFQWSREGWPPGLSASQSGATDLTNYIPNGQFLIHNEIPADGTLEAGEIREPVTIIAQGGWSFNRPEASSATDIVTFEALASTTNPSGNPRFAVQVNCQIPSSGDTVKDLRVKFTDVNKFASDDDQYTFAMTGESLGTGSVTVELILIKSFDGTAEDETPIDTLVITNAFRMINSAPFVFGINTGEVITADSYVQLAIRFPTAAAFNVQITDTILTLGAVTITDFPPTTDATFKDDSIFGWVDLPAADGSDLYLMPMLTKYGMRWDDSVIGDVVYETQTSLYVDSLHPTTNRMLADGTTYLTAHYSDLGIPFARLQAKYWIESLQVPRYGTGADYMTTAFAGTGNQLIITNNSAGAVTDAANGTPSTTFTIATIHQGDDGYSCSSYLVDTDTFYIANDNPGIVTDITANTSGFTVVVVQIGNAVIPQISSVQTIAASGISAGDYFTFFTYDAMEVEYYCWFKIDNVGSDPAPGGTGIEVDLLSTDTAAIVAQKIQLSLNGWEVTTVLTVAASAVPAGSYFNISTTGDDYYVWYKKDGAGVNPSPANKIGIEVDILGTDTNTQVASKTQRAINFVSFASPDFRDMFLRGLSNGATLDPGVRYSIVPGIIGDTLGTFELSGNLNHTHPLGQEGSVFGSEQSLVKVNSPEGGFTYADGISESRPINANVNIAIIY